ncbi:MAG: arginine deiminase family protein [Anaerolineaceae bacterium]
MFTRCIVRPPAETFALGLTTAHLGVPDFSLALQQHEAYCHALKRCGLELTALPPDPNYPDSTFVEDTAILTERCAVLTHPGAPSREGEAAAIRPILAQFYPRIHTITAPGTLDGGDICDADGHFFIGISERTNEEGARQLAEFLILEGYTASYVDVRGVPGILHLKSGIASLGGGHLLLMEALADHAAFEGYHRHIVPPEETYAANCIRVNETVLVAAGFPQVGKLVENLGLPVILLNMSEFEKMDGGLSCLSLRF